MVKANQVTGGQLTVAPGVIPSQTLSITDMINAMMPLFMLMMFMAIMMPMMKGMTGAFQAT